MSEGAVRCPYCVLEDEFRPMFRHPGKKRFVCLSCGHTAMPLAIASTCHCPKCRLMSRIANRCRQSAQQRERAIEAAAGR